MKVPHCQMMSHQLTTHDASVAELRRLARQRFAKAHRLEAQYLRQLQGVVRQIDSIVKGMAPQGVVHDLPGIQRVLNQYSETIRPWARSVAERILAEISRRDEAAWHELGKETGRALRKEIQSAPTGATLRLLLDEQVALITSLPTEAGQRVHKLTLEAIADSSRAKEIAADILRTGKVTESRAKCIARTEVARTAAGLTQSRAEHVGITHYIWRTAGDVDVRKSHKEMNGKVIAYNEPPVLSDGTQTHAGMIFNCRCYQEPILPED